MCLKVFWVWGGCYMEPLCSQYNRSKATWKLVLWDWSVFEMNTRGIQYSTFKQYWGARDTAWKSPEIFFYNFDSYLPRGQLAAQWSDVASGETSVHIMHCLRCSATPLSPSLPSEETVACTRPSMHADISRVNKQLHNLHLLPWSRAPRCAHGSYLTDSLCMAAFW